MVTRYPYIDRSPCIVPAGKSFYAESLKAADCMNDVVLSEKVDAIRKQFGFFDEKDYGPDRKGAEFRGLRTEISDCISPPIKTHFQKLHEEMANTVYDSYWNKVVGKSRDPTPGLPRGMDIYCTKFGIPTKFGISAGEIINPKKTSGEIIYEDRVCHELYKFSHQNYYPGEQVNRSYAPPYDPCKTYGITCRANDDGLNVKRVLTWFNNDPISKVSRRQAAVRERTSAPIGQTVDRTGVSKMFDVYHTFGKPSDKDLYGVEDLLNEYNQSLLRKDVKEFISCTNKLRMRVQRKINSGELMLDDLYEEFMKLDKENKYVLHFDCIDKICAKYVIKLDRSKIEPFLVMLGILKQDGYISYKEFIDFIDPNMHFPSLKRQHYIMPPEYQEYDKTVVLPEEKCTCGNYFNPPAGLPTNPIRKHNPYYEECRVNMEHLGAETNARALISPSIYTQYGLSHRDFFMPRTKEFLATLFRKIGCTLTDEDVDELYKEGAEMDNSGGVCVETFKNLLDVRAYKTYNWL